jgi:hypothetical protein
VFEKKKKFNNSGYSHETHDHLNKLVLFESYEKEYIYIYKTISRERNLYPIVKRHVIYLVVFNEFVY